jgi:two-component system OmpR family sensor kinase
MNSIRRTLLLWLSVGIGGGIAVAALLIYSQAREQANQLFDYQMQQLVASLPDRAFSPIGPGHDENGDERDIVIQIWDNNGLRIYRSHENTMLPQRAELGFSNVAANGAMWRVYSAQLGGTIIQVAQPMRDRLQLAARMALKTVAPLLLLLPLLAILIWVTVGRSLASVGRAVDDVRARDAGLLTPISDASLPQEIRPLVVALNELLVRLAQSIAAQRSFVADAAHELKTPLTALNLQLQLAERAQNEDERQAAFADLKQGIERMRHLVHQLLSMARQEPGASDQDKKTVDLAALAGQVVTHFAAMAESRSIDLGLHAAPASITGNGDALRTLLENLVDNALRYCPAGAIVDVCVEAEADAVKLMVRDNGPGIPPEALPRIFDRFYRVDGSAGNGSGLGLAIVKRIAAMHSAEIIVENGASGLGIGIRIPVAAHAQ